MDFIEIDKDNVILKGRNDIDGEYFCLFEMPDNIKQHYCQHPANNKELWICSLDVRNYKDKIHLNTHYMRPLCNKNEFKNITMGEILDTAYGAFMDGAR